MSRKILFSKATTSLFHCNSITKVNKPYFFGKFILSLVNVQSSFPTNLMQQSISQLKLGWYAYENPDEPPWNNNRKIMPAGMTNKKNSGIFSYTMNVNTIEGLNYSTRMPTSVIFPSHLCLSLMITDNL